MKSGDGANVWSETYDRELKDIFAVQSEIAGAVAKELKVALLGKNGQSAQLTTGHAFQSECGDLQRPLAGEFLSESLHPGGHPKSDRLLRGGDPARPSLRARLCEALARGAHLGGTYGGFSNERERRGARKVRASAKRSPELDPNLAEAHPAQAEILN